MSDDVGEPLSVGRTASSSITKEHETLTSFDGAAIAIADCETDDEAAAFFAAARAGPAFRSMSSTTRNTASSSSDRSSTVSPVVVAISTDGAAPILAQAIRRRIETLLPPSLLNWAALAHSLRETVIKLLPAARAAGVLGAFVDRAFGRAPLPGEALVFPVGRCNCRRCAQARGRVTLVGAGPGDAELLTLKAVRALQAADVILFDDLVSDEVLELARREATSVAAGTCGGREKAGDALVSLAQSGRHVVRLKSSKTNFGNGEISRLHAEGIAFDIVPGVSVAMAAASARAASRANRVRNEAGRFATGHSRNMAGDERAAALASGG